MFPLRLFSFQKLYLKFTKFSRLIHAQHLRYKNMTVNLSEPAVQKYLQHLILENFSIQAKDDKSSEDLQRLREIQPIVNFIMERTLILNDMDVLKDMHSSLDDEVARKYVRHESQIDKDRITTLDNKITSALVSPPLTDSRVLLEVSAGDGNHAPMFVEELFRLYKLYAEFRQWFIVETVLIESNKGGLKQVLLLLEGLGTAEYMNSENGMHYKITGTDGQINVCTASVTVMHSPSDPDAGYPDSPQLDTYRNISIIKDRVTCVTEPIIERFVKCLQDKSMIRNQIIATLMMKTLFMEPMKFDDVGLSPIQNKIRTYDYIEDVVIEECCDHKETFNLTKFLQGGKELEELQFKILRQQRYHWLKNEIQNFIQKYVNNKENVYTFY